MMIGIGEKRTFADNRAPVVIFPPQSPGNVPELVWWHVAVCLIYGTIEFRHVFVNVPDYLFTFVGYRIRMYSSISHGLLLPIIQLT